jgi:hypothetical protein
MYRVLLLTEGVYCFTDRGSSYYPGIFETKEKAEEGIRLILRLCMEPNLCREMYEIIEAD